MKNYSSIQKFLHDLVLSKDFINRSLFELEKIFYLTHNIPKTQQHVFITGLPRSGTTSLLNFLFSTEKYASLTYENMPFVFSPNFSKYYSKNNVARKERMHSDGVQYDGKSPEAFDEIFFNQDEIFVKNELENYIQLILKSKNKSFYLSKNNLNYKRIKIISSIFSRALFLIPIRDPLQHALSLFNQHLHFCNLQKQDNFIRRYMNYLGHNEFGLDHKSWNKPINFNNYNDLNYWLEQWTLFYKNILENYKFNKNCFFLIYEKLEEENYIKMLLKKIDLKNSQNINYKYFRNSNKKEIKVSFNQINYQNAKAIYFEFNSRFSYNN